MTASVGPFFCTEGAFPYRGGISTTQGYFAAIRYGGYSNPEKVQRFTQQLKKILAQENKKIIGHALVLSYDAPYKFYNRRNEILFEIAQ